MSDVSEPIIDILFSKMRDQPRPTVNARLSELSIKSMDFLDVIFAIEEKFDISIPYSAETATKLTTVQALVDEVTTLLSKKNASAC